MENEIQMDAATEIAVQTLRLDSREAAYFQRELEHIKSATYDVRYPALKARDFIPVSHDADPTDLKITYRVWDAFGMAQVIAHWADDLPHVELSGKEFSTPVVDIGVAYGYSLKELRAGARTGRSLPATKAEKAREFTERRVDDIAATGCPEAGMPGLLNHPNIPLVVLPTGTWASASAELILADMNYMVTQIVTNTLQTEEPDTLLLGTRDFLLVAQKVAGNQLADTILGIFLKTNPYIKNVASWVKLDTASATGGRRILCYKADPRVLQLEIPQEFEQLPVQARNLGFEVNCTAAIGGTVIRYPLSACYADGT